MKFWSLVIACAMYWTQLSYCDDEEIPSSNPCSPGDTGVYAHPDECQLFYNCAIEQSEPNLGPNVDECPYPMQFNQKNKRCDSFNVVDCGTRRQVYNGCDYRKNKYRCEGARSPTCRPCFEIDYPSCEFLKDGANVHPLKQGPYFIECQQRRFLSESKCPVAGGVQLLFNTVTNGCSHPAALVGVSPV